MYSTLQYFFKAYCTLSVHEEEIAEAMKEFLEQEEQENIQNLQEELLHICEDEAWEEGCVLAAKYGNRIWSLGETKNHLETFMQLLHTKKA
ncbi:hypothetical protein [Bacillus cytotoxicus]|uniref:hypothetical protein n=1 Tax=Bacillus cytotoxicus TaxID=580165 RepID=UPI000660EB5E|nr:hypothetical protein [Bacillus cytotoxicus]AWC31522.1 hypothetical protein CG482_003050 [Bacillus cytotoxicus]AWC35562.1 hypothetical protein CG481_003050 [Bacillus cytotoxicus]AWC59793.1 hypothetical protein CG474_003115 [Bacillus cytotoxicus]KMT50008.1 hypothetical protein TU51_11515 [Bacillus cytotoxicus]QTR80541.1 hypothetical protein JC773_08950 [Bacillus cytotoxicus]